MPLKRITIKTQVWRKLLSLQKREKHFGLRVAMENLKKVTLSPKNNTIIWEPPADFCQAAIAALEEELSFLRKPHTITYKFVESTIIDLKAYSDANEPSE